MGSKYSMYSRELFDRYVINVLRLRTDFSVTGSDKGVKFSWKHTIQISDRRLLLTSSVQFHLTCVVERPIEGEVWFCDDECRTNSGKISVARSVVLHRAYRKCIGTIDADDVI